jgi:class 3 adenylate cyclase
MKEVTPDPLPICLSPVRRQAPSLPFSAVARIAIRSPPPPGSDEMVPNQCPAFAAVSTRSRCSRQRRLAAVLAADVAGYSRLMGADEEGTLARLKAFRRALIDPAIATYRGRIVKTTGDGMLVEFASAVDAARCAVEIQRSMAAHSEDVTADLRLEFRIGIHVGDIIDDNDISAME